MELHREKSFYIGLKHIKTVSKRAELLKYEIIFLNSYLDGLCRILPF